jgi:YegS/Rv2252/BmrU family lipid kinase
MNTRKRRVVFIINPASGTDEKDSVTSQIEGIIDPERIDFEIRYTEHAGHAVEISAEAVRKGVDVVVAVGGDGTVNEVGRSLAETDTALGILPSGSGNGLARHLQIPMDTRKALEVINEGLTEWVDYGKINGTPFFCTCGVGFDAFISFKFAEAGKRGMLTYFEKTLQESLNYRPETYELETEGGKVKHKAFLIACGNASQYGNNAYIAPKAMITDGELDVTILEPFTVLDVPSLAFQLFNRTIDYNSRIKTFRCKSLRIRRAEPGVAHYDGEPMFTDADIYIEIISRKLNMVVPREKERDTLVDDIVRKNKSLIRKWKRKG